MDSSETVNIEKSRLYQLDSTPDTRPLVHRKVEGELVVVGGGLSGVCAAIAAAREGLSVILVQDRPVLGGNASSEVRLWILGATSHMGNNNRWARESGIVGEIMVENLYRNPEGNPLILDSLLLEKVCGEPNIQLFLNTAVFEVAKSEPSRIESVRAFCSQNSTLYTLSAPLFMDCSGDGIVSFMAGAAFRMGAETADEFGEKLAPDKGYGYLLGDSLYFYSKDSGKPVSYIKPAFADADIEAILPYRSFNLDDQGCKFWWIEYGGRHDTVHDTETIKWELWKVVYGIWDYIKNSGKFPEAETHTLEWVGMIPGKRESRRFEGFSILTQQDVVEQRTHPDAVAYGGWALDLHPADGVYSDRPPCHHWHSRGIYAVPLSMTLSRHLDNLAYGGRIISASHVAFGSTRVMATCAYIAQATAVALAFASRESIPLSQLSREDNITGIQQRLHRMGQHIPGVPSRIPDDVIAGATVTASSSFALIDLPDDGPGLALDVSTAMLIPTRKGRLPSISLTVRAAQQTSLKVQLRMSRRPGNYTPDHILEEMEFNLSPGENSVEISFSSTIPRDDYCFLCFLNNPHVTLPSSKQRVTGVLSVFNDMNKSVSNEGIQKPLQDIGIDTFEFWCPRRRPNGQNIALKADRPLFTFGPDQLQTGFERPTTQPNAWVADPTDPQPSLRFDWNTVHSLNRVVISLDTDFDHPMESVLMGHPESVIPFCVRNLKLLDQDGRCVAHIRDNYQTRVEVFFEQPLKTKTLKLQVEHPSPGIPAAVFAVSGYTA